MSDNNRNPETPEVELRVHSPRVGTADDHSKFVAHFNAGRKTMCVGRQVYFKPKFRGRSQILQGAAFAFMATSPYDVRPHLLQVSNAQRVQSFAPVLAYCRNYLRGACLHENMKISDQHSDEIALRALLSWLFTKLSGPIDDQQTGIRITRDLFRWSFGLVYGMLRHRYAEAVAQYRTVTGPNCGFRVRSGSGRYNGIYKLENRTAERAARSEYHETPIGPRITAAIPPRTVLPSTRMIPHENIFSPGANLCAAGAPLRAESERCT